MRHYCTYFDRNYLVKALALIESLNAHERNAFQLFVICLDEISRVILEKLRLHNVVIIPLHAIEGKDIELLAVRPGRSLAEYYWTLTPTMILRILEEDPNIDVITYLDADLFFYSSPDPIFDELADNAVLIHEHRFSPALIYLEENGRYNVGLLSFRNDNNGRRVLSWWRERCIEWCFARAENGRFADQAYLNDWPQRFKNVSVLQHIGAGVGPWNHEQYDFQINTAGQTLVSGRPLVFYHFHSFVFVHPGVIVPAKHTVYPLTEPILRLCHLPYIHALDRSIRQAQSILPDYEFGLHHTDVLTAQHTFMAHKECVSRIVQPQFPQIPFPLDDQWTCYRSPQMKETDRSPSEVSKSTTETVACIQKEMPLVSAIVSVYKAGKFIRGCLQDLVGQTLYQKGQLEIIVVNSGSPENEDAIIREFQARHSGIHCIKTDQRETVYGAWNRGIQASSGRYITNANTDDRHRVDALEVMAHALDAHPDVGLVYGDTLITTHPNETFESSKAEIVLKWPDFSIRQLLMYSIFGSQPMWRRTVHEKLGFFDAKYVVAGDYEFFIRLGWKYGAHHIPEILGLYYQGSGVELGNQSLCTEETRRVLRNYRTIVTPRDIYPGLQDSPDKDAAHGATWVDYGNCLISGLHPDFELAEKCYQNAHRILQNEPGILNNIALARFLSGKTKESLTILSKLEDLNYATGRYNKQLVETALKEGTIGMVLARFTLATLRHPCVDTLPALVPAIATRQLSKAPTRIARHSEPTDPKQTAKPFGLSFCVITGGQRPVKLKNLTESIHVQGIPQYEIIVAGIHENRPDIIYLPMPEAARGGRTSVLRNTAAARSKYNHIVFVDDDIVLDEKWFAGIKPHLGKYDLLACKLLNPDGTRHWDWSAFGGARGHALLDYDAVDEHLYLTSGICTMKTEVWEKIKWDETLGFEECEDVDFSQRVLKAGFRAHLCQESVAIHDDARYTQIGRFTLKRSKEGTRVWLEGGLLTASPEDLKTGALTACKRGEAADSADCFRALLKIRPDDKTALQQLDNLVEACAGQTDCGVWQPSPILKSRPSDKLHAEKMALQNPAGSEQQRPLVSAIVSVYKCEPFIYGCLQDLFEQTLYQNGQLEIIVINSGSPQNEDAVIREFQAKHSGIKYIKTEQRETVYGAWNRGIQAASGKYITNSNADDRHRRDAFEVMAAFLEQHPDVALVYADQLITEIPNDHFEYSRATRRWNWPKFSYTELERRCITGSQPMWQKSLHDTYGLFRSEFASAGDYEFWLRIGKREKLFRISDILGLYYQNPNGLEISSGTAVRETHAIWNEYGILKRGIQPAGSVPVEISQHELDSLPFRKKAANTPLVSVIVSTYNRAHLLGDALKSIVNQTYPNIEILVVNDGGVDVGPVIQAHNQRGNITYIRHDRNRGRSATRNSAIARAKGKYLAYLDDDDVYYPHHLSTLVHFLEQKGEWIAYSRALKAIQKPVEGRFVTIDVQSIPTTPFNPDGLLISNFISNNTIVYRRECLDQVGMFDETFSVLEDWELLIRLSRAWNFQHVPVVTCEVRWRTDVSNISTGGRDLFVEMQKRIYEKHRCFVLQKPEVRNLQKKVLYGLAQEVKESRLRKSMEAYTDDSPQKAQAPILSIIIPVFNQVNFTRQCLESITQNTPYGLYEIIVVDNASADETPSLLQSWGGGLRFIRNEKNMEFGRACNQGAKIARGEYVVFLNNDTVPLPKWAEHAIEHFKHDPQVGIVGSKLLYPDGTIQHGGVEFVHMPRMPDGIWPQHRFRGVQSEYPEANVCEEVEAVTAACLFIPRKLFLELGGFSEEYRMYFEDMDLNLRVRALGRKVIYEPKSVVTHYESKSTLSELANQLLLQSAALFDQKWGNRIERVLSGGMSVAPDQLHLTWDGAFFENSGYGAAMRMFVLGLDRLGVPLQIEFPKEGPDIVKRTEPDSYARLERLSKIRVRPDVYIRGCVPYWDMDIYELTLNQNPGFGYYIGYTMFETDRIPSKWVQACNQMDEMWVPSRFNQETFAGAGVCREKLHVLPIGLDTRVYNPEFVEPVKIEACRGFTFLSVFEWSQHKGWDVLLRAYMRAFSPAENVNLILHATVRDGKPVKERVEEFAASIGRKLSECPRILISDQQISHSQLLSLYRSVDAFVLPSRGEGWGIPYMEAMAMGLPTIGTRWSSNLDFMNEENSCLIDCEVVEIPEQCLGEPPLLKELYQGHRWAEPSVEHTAKLMREVYEQHDIAKGKGIKAREHILRNYSSQRIAAIIMDHLKRIGNSPLFRSRKSVATQDTL